MENEKEDNKKSNKRCDHSEYKKFIPASWVKYIQDEIKKNCYWVIIILLPKIMTNTQIHSLKSYLLN